MNKEQLHDWDRISKIHDAIRERFSREGISSSNVSVATLGETQFITTDRLMKDTRTLMEKLPADIDGVVGISRSGVLPGSLIATHLHVPLYTVSRHAGVLFPGHGGRLEGYIGEAKKVLLIDDTVAHGREMTANLPTVQAFFPAAKIIRAVVYAHPKGVHAVDHFVHLYEGPHYLEWNWCNAGHGAACGYDFDGILCHDCPVDDDDDGPRYRRFLETARPLFLPRRMTVPLIVTARHRKYEDLTRAWLNRHGVRVDQLVMRDFNYDPSLTFHDQVAEFKARHYRESSTVLFAESDPKQAELIAASSGKPVLCPAAARVFPGTPIVSFRFPTRVQIEQVNLCLYRECSTGCQSSKCFAKRKGNQWSGENYTRVSLADCSVCLSVRSESPTP